MCFIKHKSRKGHEQSCRATSAPEAQASFPPCQRVVWRDRGPFVRFWLHYPHLPTFSHLQVASLFCLSSFLCPCGSIHLFSLGFVGHNRKQSILCCSHCGSAGEVRCSLKSCRVGLQWADPRVLLYQVRLESRVPVHEALGITCSPCEYSVEPLGWMKDAARKSNAL